MLTERSSSWKGDAETFHYGLHPWTRGGCADDGPLDGAEVRQLTGYLTQDRVQLLLPLIEPHAFHLVPVGPANFVAVWLKPAVVPCL